MSPQEQAAKAAAQAAVKAEETGQIIILSHEENVGAGLVADSLTDLVLNGRKKVRRGRGGAEAPAVAWVNHASLQSVEAAVHPGLEVLSLGVWDGEPFSLAPVTGLPRLRTLMACQGTLADPLEIARLRGLEYLELGPEDWRVLLDAGAVPRSLLAAGIEVRGDRHPLRMVALTNEILALWDRPPITRTVLDGDPPNSGASWRSAGWFASTRRPEGPGPPAAGSGAGPWGPDPRSHVATQ